jgi:hypothetical protein
MMIYPGAGAPGTYFPIAAGPAQGRIIVGTVGGFAARSGDAVGGLPTRSAPVAGE